MQSRIASFSSPMKWLSIGAQAIRNQTLGMISVTMFYVFMMSLLGALPIAGLLLAAIFMPFGTLLIAEGTRDALLDQTPRYGRLLDVWRTPKWRTPMIRLGVIYACFLFAANYLYLFTSMDAMKQWQTVDGQLVWETVWNNIPWTALILTTASFLIGQMCTWFAPMLIVHKDMSVGKAVFYSFFGCLRNWGAALVLMIIIVAMTVGSALVISTLVNMLGIHTWAAFIFMPLAFGLTSWAYSTIWPMWVDIFGDVNG